MDIVVPKEMQRIEQLAYTEGASEALFMEAAGKEVAEAAVSLLSRCSQTSRVILLCGCGNNAGDAYVAGTHLIQSGELEVCAIQLGDIHTASPLCQHQHQRFLDAGGAVCTELPPVQLLAEAGLLIDGLLGTGFHGELKGNFHSLVEAANASGTAILSIDIPSGLDGQTGIVGTVAIRATETLFLGLPKQGFFLQQGWNHVGRLVHGDFGLEDTYIKKANARFKLLSLPEVAPFLLPLSRDQHKYEAGHVMGLAGSPGMPGAALLAGTAALRAGAGIVRLLHSPGMQVELSAAPYELIRQVYDDQDPLSIAKTLNEAQAIFIGPGLGRSPEVFERLSRIIPLLEVPLVLDADGLNALASRAFTLPKGSILTPHHGEMQRLLGKEGKSCIDLDYLESCQSYAEKHEIILILKGGPTFLFAPREYPHICSFGHPGMATAGTGDVLTGILAACLAKGLGAFKAARLGVTLHALAGEAAADEWTGYSILASDIIEALPQSFRCLNPICCI